MFKILDYLKFKEQEGCTIKADIKEDSPHGLVVTIVNDKGNLEFVAIIGPKTLGEWIKIHAA